MNDFRSLMGYLLFKYRVLTKSEPDYIYESPYYIYGSPDLQVRPRVWVEYENIGKNYQNPYKYY